MTTTNVNTDSGRMLQLALASLMVLAAIVLVLFPDLAFAATGDGKFGGETRVLTKSCSFLQTVKSFFFATLYILGAIGLGVIAVKAYMGQFSFKSLFALGGGVFLVAVSDITIGFLTEGAGKTDCVMGLS